MSFQCLASVSSPPAALSAPALAPAPAPAPAVNQQQVT